MPWFRVDDGFADHPKTIELLGKKGGDRALNLWLLAGVWAAKQMADGRVPTAMVSRLGYRRNDADLLVRCGLWESTETGYQYHDWARCNETRSQIETRRERTRNKVRNHRAKPDGNRLQTETVTGTRGSGSGSGLGETKTSWDWREAFALAWAAKFGRFYGHSGDSKACGALDATWESWPVEQKSAAWAQRDRMFAEFFADKGAANAGHIFAFFVPRFGALLAGSAKKTDNPVAQLRAQHEKRRAARAAN